MSIGTRSYARPYGSRGGLPRGVQALLIANGALFLVLFFLRSSADTLLTLLALTPSRVVESLNIWQLGTFLFVNTGIFGFAFNMLALWMFGRELEEMWGTQRFVRFYFLCGSGAGVFVILAQYLVRNPGAAVFGCIPAVYGILAAYAAYWPDRQMIFFIFPMQVKYAVLLIAVVDFLLSYEAGLGQLMLLTGLVIGYLYVKWPKRVGGFNPLAHMQASYKEWKLRRAKRKFQVYLRKHGSDRDRFIN